MKPYIMLSLLVLGLFLSSSQPVKAETAVNACEVIGNIGNILVSRCQDPQTNAVFFGNSVGWLTNIVE